MYTTQIDTLVHEITGATPNGIPLLGRYRVVLGTILMQSMIGQTLRHSVILCHMWQVS